MANGKNGHSAYFKEAAKLLAVLLATALVLILIFLISHCDGDDKTPSVHSAEISQTVIKDTETGISYVRCPVGIGANTLKDEFLTVGSGGIVLYTIFSEDSARFIAEAKDALGGSYVYRAEDEPPITLEGFAPVSAGIFMDGLNAPIDHFYAKEVENAEDGTVYIEYIKTALSGKPVDGTTGELTDTEYYIRLYSANYPGLYYEVVFCTDVNGVAYLRDMVTDRLYLSPDGLTVRIIG